MGNIGMEILKFENAPAPRKSAPKKSNLKSLAGLATVAAVAVLGSTLAANISLGSGSALEFGQGVQTTAACDSSITVSPQVSFVNSSTNPQFMLSTISLTDVDATVQGTGDATGCDGKTLTINAYGDTSATPLSIASSSNTAYSYATVGVKAVGTMTTSPGITVTVSGTQNSTTAGIAVGITSPQATSGAVYKLTLQSN
jgi:carbon monoxide dehydrogenase subunit G